MRPIFSTQIDTKSPLEFYSSLTNNVYVSLALDSSHEHLSRPCHVQWPRQPELGHVPPRPPTSRQTKVEQINAV